MLSGSELDEAFDEIVGFEFVRPLRVRGMGPPDTPMPVRILGLDGAWVDAVARHRGAGLWLDMAIGSDHRRAYAGLSGSPILDTRNRAIAVFAAGGNRVPFGPQPTLEYCLPLGLWRALHGRPEPVRRWDESRSGG